jgi:hypothetical protein
MATLGYILLGIALLPYIAVPILIWNTQRYTSAFHLRLLQETFLPKPVLTQFAESCDALKEQGFQHCFDAVSLDEFLGIRFYHRILVSRIQKTWAICTAICDPDGKLQKSYLELKSELSNLRTLSTHNSELLGAPIKSRHARAVVLPADTPAELMLDIHRQGLNKVKEEELIEPDSLLAEETFRRFLVQDHEEQLELGAIYFDNQEKVYRPTWAGAILIGWYSMWPLTVIRRFISSLRTRTKYVRP